MAKKYIIKHRRKTTEEWATTYSSLIPYDGELVIEKCADGTEKAKIGDGVNTFSGLNYVSIGGSGGGVKFVSITLPSASWTGTVSPYSQAVTITGITNKSMVDLKVSPTVLNILENEAAGLIAENDNSVVKIYAIGNKPSQDLTIQAIITETN